jgi:hypothetical protein
VRDLTSRRVVELIKEGKESRWTQLEHAGGGRARAHEDQDHAGRSQPGMTDEPDEVRTFLKEDSRHESE